MYQDYGFVCRNFIQFPGNVVRVAKGIHPAKIVIKVTKPGWRCATFRQDAVVHICANAKTHYAS